MCKVETKSSAAGLHQNLSGGQLSQKKCEVHINQGHFPIYDGKEKFIKVKMSSNLFW